jgi:hypothetical protein
MLWSHKLAAECKTDDHVNRLAKEWDQATSHFSDYQFKSAVQKVRSELNFFPTIAEFIKFIPQHSEEKLCNNLTASDVEVIKNQMHDLAEKRLKLIKRQDLNAKTMYTFSRAIDEQLATMHVQLRNSGVNETEIP